MFLIALYLFAIVAANLLVARFGAGLCQMFPCGSSDDHVDRFPTNTKLTGNFIHFWPARISTPDFEYFLRFQARQRVSFTASQVIWALACRVIVASWPFRLSTTLAGHIVHVVLIRTQEKVRGIYTGAIITLMQNPKPFGDRAVVQFPRNAVRALNRRSTPFYIYCAVSLCPRPFPLPTRSQFGQVNRNGPVFVNLSPKPAFKSAIFVFHALTTAILTRAHLDCRSLYLKVFSAVLANALDPVAAHVIFSRDYRTEYTPLLYHNCTAEVG